MNRLDFTSGATTVEFSEVDEHRFLILFKSSIALNSPSELFMDEILVLNDPPRVVFDISSRFLKASRGREIIDSRVQGLRFGSYGERVRMVVDLKSFPSSTPVVTLQKGKNQVAVAVDLSPPQGTVSSIESVLSPALPRARDLPMLRSQGPVELVLPVHKTRSVMIDYIRAHPIFRALKVSGEQAARWWGMIRTRTANSMRWHRTYWPRFLKFQRRIGIALEILQRVSEEVRDAVIRLPSRLGDAVRRAKLASEMKTAAVSVGNAAGEITKRSPDEIAVIPDIDTSGLLIPSPRTELELPRRIDSGPSGNSQTEREHSTPDSEALLLESSSGGMNWHLVILILGFLAVLAFMARAHLYAVVYGASFENSEPSDVPIFAPASAEDPYQILGCKPTDSMDEIRSRYRHLMKSLHDDRLRSQNLPEEVLRLARSHLESVRDAYHAIKKDRDGSKQPHVH